jgi:spore maturation protein CgeB
LGEAMRILLSGYHNPNFTNSMVYRDKAVESLGHELISFEDRSFIVPGRLRERFSLLAKWDLQRINNNLIGQITERKPDVCLIIGGHRILASTVEEIKSRGFKIALWTTDPPTDFKNILEAAPFYDHLFCAGSEAADIFNNNGLTNVTWIPFACDPNFHKPIVLSIEEQKKYGKDVVFVGSYYPNRANLLESLADLDLGIWGPYWDKLDSHSPLKGKTNSVKINYDEWVKIYNAAKIVLVIHYQNLRIPCHQASPKLFEAMACRRCVFCDNQRDAKELFRDGHDVIFFSDAQDLRKKVGYYLNHAEERLIIGRQACLRVTTEHTYQHRIAQMLSILMGDSNIGDA